MCLIRASGGRDDGPLLEMNNMSVELPIGLKVADIVSDITLTLNRGERLGVVGESGSGKSITALAAMGLLPDRMRVRGTLRFDGQDLAATPEAELCRMRGRRMAMIFQEPMTALNPVKLSVHRLPKAAVCIWAKAAPMPNARRESCLIVWGCQRRASISIFTRTSFPAGNASA